MTKPTRTAEQEVAAANVVLTGTRAAQAAPAPTQAAPTFTQVVQASAGEPETAETAPTPAPVDLADTKVAELKALCVDRGVDFDPKARKAELVALLVDHKKAMAPRHGQEICKVKGCGYPLRVRQTFAPIETEPRSGVFIKVRRVQCKGPRQHSYKITEKVDGNGNRIADR